MNLLFTGTRLGREDVWMLADMWLRNFRKERPDEPIRVLHGGARGVDTQAGAWAKERGFKAEIVEADWQTLGRAAGMIRNQVLVDLCEPTDVCLAFPSERSRGTWDCVRKARAKGMTVFVL